MIGISILLSGVEETIQILIVEDDELIAMDMDRLVGSMGHQVVEIVDNSDDALQLLENHTIDVAILDIRIQGRYDGIELSEKLQMLHESIAILFVTSMQDDLTFNRASRSNPMGFLVKPYTEIQFKRSLALVIQQLKDQLDEPGARDAEDDVRFNQEAIFVKKRNHIQNIFFKDIHYLEADGGKYSKIITGDDVFVIRYSLKELSNKIKNDEFVKCHRSYVINIKQIESVDLSNNIIKFRNRKVPISRREKNNLLKRLDYL